MLALTAGALALIVGRAAPPSALWDAGALMRGRNNIAEQTGHHANDVALILVVGFWTAVVVVAVVKKAWMKYGLSVIAVGILVAMMLCKSRGGMLAFSRRGCCSACCAIASCWPSSRSARSWSPCCSECGGASDDGLEDQDVETMTAGRMTTLWPPVIDAIEREPLVGYGRLESCTSKSPFAVYESQRQMPSHPHNAYLELLLDSGLVGLVVVLAFLLRLLYCMFVAARYPDPLLAAAGAVGLTALTAYMMAGLAGHSLFFTDRTVFIWCFIAVGYRAYLATCVERRRSSMRAAATMRAPARPIGARP